MVVIDIVHSVGLPERTPHVGVGLEAHHRLAGASGAPAGGTETGRPA